MSVEAMWSFVSGSVREPENMEFGGIVILETGRIFGGDSGMAYTGTYEVNGDTLRAKAKTWFWNTAFAEVSVFGSGPGDVNHLELVGTIEGNAINGVLRCDTVPGIELRAKMEKIADLP